MKKLFILLLPFLILSCSNFYEFSSRTEEKEMYRAFKMPIEKDTLEFNAYNDYYYDTIDLNMVYISSKELRHLKKSTLKSRKNQQILFLHNDTSNYLNIVGFYYPNLYLNEIQKPEFEFEPIPLTQGLGFEYNYNQKQVSDFYIPHKNGIMRFLAIGNPEWANYFSDRFHMEIDFVFYVINAKYFRLKPQ